MTDLSEIRIDDCDLTSKTLNALSAAGFVTLADVDIVSDHALRQCPRVGTGAVFEVREVIRAAKSRAEISTQDVVRWALDHADVIRALMPVIP